jgi:hypothetical protein
MATDRSEILLREIPATDKSPARRFYYSVSNKLIHMEERRFNYLGEPVWSQLGDVSLRETYDLLIYVLETYKLVENGGLKRPDVTPNGTTIPPVTNTTTPGERP